MKILQFALLLSIASYPAAGAITYSFELEPLVGRTDVEAVNFTVVSPKYLQEGPFTIEPFQLTFEGESTLITHGYLSAFYKSFCFSFGSVEAILGPCAFDSGQTGVAFGGQFHHFNLPDPVPAPAPSSYWLPSSPGTFIAGAPVVESGSNRAVFNLTITITETSTVPEPATSITALFTIVAGLLAYRVVGRR